MARIAVIGGSGYAGRQIVAEAVRRGHAVLSIARRVPSERAHGAMYIEGSLTDVPALRAQLVGVDVVVCAVPPRGDMAGLVRPNIAALVSTLPEGVRFGVIGGAVSSLVTAAGERIVDLPSVAGDYMPEALESIGILDDLQAAGGSLDWFHIHPSGGFEGWDPDEPTSSEAGWTITDASGQTSVSGIDLERVVVDQIENPRSARGA
jgi:putative NADH-flavin reductase